MGCNSPSAASPSIVVTALPSQRAASVRQERTRAPSTCTVHAPQEPRSQPFFVPLRRNSSRSASSNVVRGSMLSGWRRPFTSSVTSAISGVRTGVALVCATAARAVFAVAAARPPAAAEAPIKAPPAHFELVQGCSPAAGNAVLLLQHRSLQRVARERGALAGGQARNHAVIRNGGARSMRADDEVTASIQNQRDLSTRLRNGSPARK